MAICARDREALEASRPGDPRADGREVLAIAGDLSSSQGAEQVVAATVEQFGALDVLVTNSGGPAPGKFGDLDDDAWREGFEVVTLSFVRLVRAALPHMRARRWGRIVAIQSSLGEGTGPLPGPLQRHPPGRRRAREGALGGPGSAEGSRSTSCSRGRS